jgi:anti-sigma regulatory factor (Ser/Thr protein kinase)
VDAVGWSDVEVRTQAEASLPSSLASAREARTFVKEAIGVPADEPFDTLELLISEVVTNAVQHTGAAPLVRVSRRGDMVRVSVQDPSPRWPTRCFVPETALSGRGIALVDVLSSSWGVEQLDRTGKQVWFEVRI